MSTKQVAVGFGVGFSYGPKGLAYLLRRPALWPYVLIPLLINTVILAGVVFGAFYYGSSLKNELMPAADASGWFAVLQEAFAVVTLVFFVALAFVVCAFVFTALGNLIAGPFNDFLTERVERIERGEQPGEPFSLKTALADIGRSIGNELKKLSFYLVGLLAIGVVGSLLGWIPLIGQLVALALLVVGEMFTMFYLGLTYVDLPMARRRWGFRKKLGWMWHRRGAMLGFGGGAHLMMLVPFVNLLLIPAAAVGATLIWIREEEDQLEDDPSPYQDLLASLDRND